MKNLKTFFATMILLTGAAVCATSCSDEKEDEPAAPAAKSVEGTYSGDMICSVMGDESTFEDVTFTLTAVDDATVKMTIPSFGNPPMQVPEITVEDIKVSGSDGTYTLASTEFSGETATGKAFSGTAQGSYVSNTLTIQFNLQYGAMPMPMICTFSAPKD